MEKRKPVTSISARTSSMARMSPLCLEASHAWRCVEGRWWSTPHKVEAARIPGCCAHESTTQGNYDALPSRGQFVLDEPIPGTGRAHRTLDRCGFPAAP